MIDTHCHLQFKAYSPDFDEVLKRCNDKKMILNAVGSQRDTSQAAVDLANKYENIYATVGLHPIHLFSTHVDEEESSFDSRAEEFDYEFYKKLALNPKTIAIGECGLELFHLPPEANRAEILQKQSDTFKLQYKLAQETNLPLVIHVRDAYQEMIDLFNEIGEAPYRGVIHCYSSNWQNAESFLKLGFHIGFTGIITFPPKKSNPTQQAELLEVVKNCPLDRMLIETDSPYLAPAAYRGKRCEPWMVEEVAKKIGEIKHLSFTEVIDIFDQNARKLFAKISNM